MSKLERWQQRFAVPGYLFGTAPSAFLKSKADLLRAEAPGKALALADGEARNGVFMAEQGLDVLSVDISPLAQDKARRLAEDRGVALRTELADLSTWTWPTVAFDVIVGIFFQFSGPAERARIFDGIKRALKPGGLLLIHGYRPEQIKYGTGGPSDPVQLYTRKILQDAFGDFASLEISEHDDMMSEGTAHVGMAATIDLVGRK